ncbi:phage tail protein [Burkholderia sp. Ac-20379]|uniref:phage tail protein n=1 Tax=Burkholderia sp. Ac-20379 TaxID=2703900 RepID=UPI0019819200|nr:phage tail protein [Burkholderia sp. Ac-20379]MBN3725629.1 tail fiber protein [Burkholderia sp. Ac-20379]
MAGNLIQITDAGRAALVAAGNTGSAAHGISAIGLATAAFAFDRGLQALPNERKRVTTFGGENVAPDTIHVVIQDNTDDQYPLYGFGLYLDNGVLFGVYVQDAPIMEKSPSAMLLLAADAIFASIDASLLQLGATSFLNPPATTERQGVVELATHDEVRAGADDLRAVTPAGAAARYMSYDGGVFNGPVAVHRSVGGNDAQLNLSAESGAYGMPGKLRFWGTFGDAHVNDPNPRLTAAIHGGFNGGIWGSEYLDFLVNRTSNDAHDDTNLTRVMRLLGGARVLFGNVADDGTSTVQAGGDIVGLGALTIGRGKARAIVNTDDLTAYFAALGDGNTMLGATGSGVTSLVTANQERVRVVPSGRVLVGTTDDDGSNLLQVAGNVMTTGCVASNRLDSGGANFRAIGGSYGAMIRNDGSSVYLLSTKQGDATGQFNDYRPFSWQLGNGKVTIDGSANGASFGGDVSVAGELQVGRGLAQGSVRVGPIDGFLYSNQDGYGWWTPNNGAFQYYIADRTFRVDGQRVWTEATVDPLDKRSGGTINGDVTMAAGKRLFLDEGTALLPSLTFVNDGSPDTGLFHTADGQFGITCNTQAIVGFATDGTRFSSNVFGPTPAANDRSTRLATTEWVLATLSASSIGQIVHEPRTNARAGYLKLNGAELNRADYPALWAYAVASGVLATDADWSAGRQGGFSTGNGTSTFRIPDLRGEFIRCWSDDRSDVDPQRGVGTTQAGQNLSHTHGASETPAGDHGHVSSTDWQGQHNHGINDPGHSHSTPIPSGGGGGNQQVVVGPFTITAYYSTHAAATGIWLNDAPAHNHNVSITPNGNHTHAITINADGGNESRPRNVALLAMIRAY